MASHTRYARTRMTGRLATAMAGVFIAATLTGPSAVTGAAMAQSAPKPASTQPAAAQAAPDTVVRNLYRYYLETEPQRLEIFDFTSPATTKDYFDPALARLLVADGKRSEPRLDFDPFVDGQDFEIDRVTLATKSVSPQEAVVTATFLNFDEPKNIAYKIVLTPAGWRIADVQWGQDRESLRALLSAKRS